MVKHKFEFFKNSGKEYILFDCSDQYWAKNHIDKNNNDR